VNENSPASNRYRNDRRMPRMRLRVTPNAQQRRVPEKFVNIHIPYPMGFFSKNAP